MLLSIILPCYNVANYLDRCIESIYAQNMSYPFEIIAVNDASTDDTLKKLKALATIYPELKVVSHSTNKKLTGARTTGMKLAKGKYIMHLDPDDFLLENCLTNIFLNNPSNWDILVGNILMETSHGLKLRYTSIPQGIIDLKDYPHKKRIFEELLTGSCFGKIIKRTLIQDLTYFKHTYNMGEDKALNFELFNKARFIIFDPKPIVRYCLNQSSLDRGVFNPAIMDPNNNWIINILDFESENKFDSIAHVVFKKYAERYTIGLLLKIRGNSNRSELFDKWERFYKSHSKLYGCKAQVYDWIMNIKSVRLKINLLLASLFQIDPYKERLKRLLSRD